MSYEEVDVVNPIQQTKDNSETSLPESSKMIQANLSEARSKLADVSGQDIVDWSVKLEFKLKCLIHHLDPSWHAALMPQWAFLDDISNGESRHRIAARLMLNQCGSIPDVARLKDPVTHLVLHDRPHMLQKLCILALCRRPGVLRCVIDKQARHMLKQALDDAFDPLMTLSSRGRAVKQEVALWSPVHWACIGYGDWASMLLEEDHALRRIVRFSLPQQLLGMTQYRRLVSGDIKPLQAIKLLEEIGVAWPC